MIRITKGLDLPLSGSPTRQLDQAVGVERVALLGRDYPGVKPSLLVSEGEQVRLGQPLFSDKQQPAVLFTSPGCGRVAAINRGERRAFVSLVIELAGDDQVSFPVLTPDQLMQLTSEQVEQRLLQSGLWTALRVRPYSGIPVPGSRPAALFVTAIDTNPLALDPTWVIPDYREQFQAGLQVLLQLTDSPIYLCQAPGADLPSAPGITPAVFAGPHPAGLAGTHIHHLAPVDQHHQAWHLGYQDLIAIGTLFLTGRIWSERIVALAGPPVLEPRLLKTRLGADLRALTNGQLKDGEQRIISGSVMSGQAISDETAFLGRYHTQISVLPEERQRRFLDWLMPGCDRHSVTRLFASSCMPRRLLPLGTSNHGSSRAMVPIGSYERVMPLDLQITWLLRSLLAQDLELAIKLGCLELDEEDLALCSYVCPSKIDYGSHLRSVLRRIAEEGL